MGNQAGENPKEELEHLGSQKINEAIGLLSEIVQEKKAEFSQLINEKYSNFRNIIREAAGTKEVISKMKQNMSETITSGEEKIKEISVEVNKRVHENPWLFLGIAATGAFLSGYIIRSGSRYRK